MTENMSYTVLSTVEYIVLVQLNISTTEGRSENLLSIGNVCLKETHFLDFFSSSELWLK